MPTVTTTVTSAAACGKTTTVTTTEATPSAATNQDVTIVEAMLNNWGAGTLKEDKAKFFATNCEIDFGSALGYKNVKSMKKYTFATISEWLDNISLDFVFNSLDFSFGASPGGACAYFDWDATSVVTGRKVTGVSGINRYWLTDGLITKVTHLTTDAATVDAACGDADCDIVAAAVGEWGAGTLLDAVKGGKYFSKDVYVDFGSKFGINHRAFTTIYNGHQGIADWIEYLTDFDFNDMQWTFSPAPGGVNANFEVSLGVKATGKTTDRYTAVLRYMMTDGLCTKCTLHISDTVSVNAAL